MTPEDTDIRNRVAADRGILKKLQLLVPGLNEYRRLEDLRAADELLRKQVCDKLDQTKANLESIRKSMANSGAFENLNFVASLISQIQQVAGEVLHAQQGSAGISPMVRIDESALNKLYEYDYNFVKAAIQLFTDTSASNLIYTDSSFSANLSKISTEIAEFKHSWEERIDAVEKILVIK